MKAVHLLYISLTLLLTQPVHSQINPRVDNLISSASADDKIAPALQARLHPATPDEMIVIEALSDDFNEAMLFLQNAYIPFTVLSQQDNYFIYECAVSRQAIQSIANLNGTRMIEWKRMATVESKQEGLDLSLNEVTKVHHVAPEINGSTFTLSIKEEAFDTSDIDFKGRYFFTSLTPAHTSIHATNMASIAAGGAISYPSAIGVAWEVDITSADFNRLLPDPMDYFSMYGITVQNHAYGTGIENYYGIEAMAYDAAVNQLPEVLHVFSSGNSGDKSAVDGLYNGLAGWANLTGQFKQSKNTIAVGAVDSADHVLLLSSRGPAYDGRIKPEVVAYGHGGSSGAAAVVSGVSILLQQAYSESNGGAMPPADLIKAIVINTAKDIERPGPDYVSGYGSVRAAEALETILSNRYQTGSVSAGEEFQFGIDVPANTKSVSLTLAWNDPAAAVNTPKALVNDLDVQLISVEGGSIYFPWLLSAKAHPDSLAANAIQGVDTVNNVEKIVVYNPPPGSYIMRVDGKKLRQGQQSFSLAWDIEEQGLFKFIYPTASDPLESDARNTIRWRTTLAEPGRLEYRNTDATAWTLITDSVGANAEWDTWHSPAATGLFQLRWTSDAGIFFSDTFMVSPVLTPVPDFVCTDSMRFSWARPAGVDSFEVYSVGEKHLEPYAVTADTFYLESMVVQGVYHYAVAPILNAHRGLKSYGFDYRTQGVACFINYFFLHHMEDGRAYFHLELGLLENIQSIRLERLLDHGFQTDTVVAPVLSLIQLIGSQPLQQGRNTFRVGLVFDNGDTIISPLVVVYHSPVKEIVIFPNPSLGASEVHVLVKEPALVGLDVYDMVGRKVFSMQEASNPQVVDVTRLPEGVYVVVVRFEGGRVEATKLFVRA